MYTHWNNNKGFNQARKVKKVDFWTKTTFFSSTALFVLLYVELGNEKWNALAPTVDRRVYPIWHALVQIQATNGTIFDEQFRRKWWKSRKKDSEMKNENRIIRFYLELRLPHFIPFRLPIHSDPIQFSTLLYYRSIDQYFVLPIQRRPSLLLHGQT